VSNCRRVFVQLHAEKQHTSREGPLTPQISPLRCALSKNIPREGPLKPQISPLRCAPVEMTKGRAALPLSVVAEQDPFFIALGGPKAHDSSGRDDKGEGGASIECGC
jgi:hypothetical protein